MEEKKSTYRKTETLKIQQRDMLIFEFLNRVGYANLEQISISVLGINRDKIHANESAILRRLYLLRRFNYIKAFSTHLGNYYALDKKGKMSNTLLTTMKLDQLENHNFLIDLFFCVQNEPLVLTDRECIAKYKIVGKKGRIPDMVINDFIIEYERDYRSTTEIIALVQHWTIEQGKNLCIIYATEEIKNRYMPSINPKVKLISKGQYRDILSIIYGRNLQKVEDDIQSPLTTNLANPLSKVGGILKKYI